MFDIFELKTGKLTPLTEPQRATLNEEQLAAYNDLAAAVADLDRRDGGIRKRLTGDARGKRCASRS